MSWFRCAQVLAVTQNNVCVWKKSGRVRREDRLKKRSPWKVNWGIVFD